MDYGDKSTGGQARLILKLMALFIVACVAITTMTHHFWPQLTGVPEHHVDVLVVVQMDAMMIILGLVTFWHGWRTMGAAKAGTFLVSAILFSGFEETVWILTGRFGSIPTYYFTYGGLWFFEIPVYTCLAWYLICYCGYTIVKDLFPRMRSAGVAAMVAAFGTCWDLWLDPSVCNRHLVSTMPDLWIWLSPTGLRLFGIPILNFAGWFGVIFMIIFLFDKKLHPAEQLDARRVGTYYLFMGIGWGMLFLALHGVGALQAIATFDFFPVTFGAPVDSATAGTAAVGAITVLVYIIVLGAGSVVTFVTYRRGNTDKALKMVPAILVGWWLNGGFSTIAMILMVYPGSTLVWLMLVFSPYPTLLAVWSVIASRSSLSDRKPATPHTP